MKLLLIVLSFSGAAYGVSELLKNSDFESSSFSGNWVCQGCSLTSSTDSYHGHHSGKVTNRTHGWAGVAQTIHVTPGQRYVFSAYVKLLNMAPGHMFHDVLIMIRETVAGHSKYITVGSSPMTTLANGWEEIGFDFKVPNGIHNIYMYIQIDDPAVNYLIDHASFKLLQYNSNWKNEANSRIERLRKAQININFHNFSASNYQVEIQQLKSKFAFGSVVDALMIVDSTHQNYQKFFYDNFEWAVLGNALKWRIMEWTQGHMNIDRPMNAIRALRSKGGVIFVFPFDIFNMDLHNRRKKVRGHNMFWGTTDRQPIWVHGMNQTTLLQAMHKHVNDVISKTRGRLEHWDVYNENLHGRYFEQHTGHKNITMEMFDWVHQTEPGVKLFLNEYQVVSASKLTTAYKNQALQFKNSGVPLYGIGIQCHTDSHLDMATLKYRLDKISEAGLPIWITEFTVNEPNVTAKADALENMLTMFMSHPAIEGVLLWGYWDGRIWIPDSALATGPNVEPNEAGKRYLQLYHTTWRTHVTQHVTGNSLHIKGFMGDYVLRVKHNGHLIQTQHFTLDKGGKTVNVNLH